MSSYGWLKNGKLQYKFDFIRFSDKPYEEFMAHGIASNKFKQAKDNNETIGVIILPSNPDIKLTKLFFEDSAYMLGLNNLVPEGIDIIMFILPTDKSLKYNLLRKIKAYNPKNQILIDMNYNNLKALYDASNFTLARQEGENIKDKTYRWQVREKLSISNLDNELIHLRSIIATLCIEDTIIKETLGNFSYDFEWLTTAIERKREQIEKCTTDSEKEKIINEIEECYENWLEKRALFIAGAREAFNMLTMGFFSELPLKLISKKELSLALSLMPQDEGFVESQFNYRSVVWKPVRKYVRELKLSLPSHENKYSRIYCELRNADDAIDDNIDNITEEIIGISASENIDNMTDERRKFLEGLVRRKSYKEYAKELEDYSKKLEVCKGIWSRTLYQEKCPFTFTTIRDTRSLSRDVINFVGESYGIKEIIRSYAEGVPIEDIL